MEADVHVRADMNDGTKLIALQASARELLLTLSLGSTGSGGDRFLTMAFEVGAAPCFEPANRSVRCLSRSDMRLDL